MKNFHWIILWGEWFFFVFLFKLKYLAFSLIAISLIYRSIKRSPVPPHPFFDNWFSRHVTINWRFQIYHISEIKYISNNMCNCLLVRLPPPITSWILTYSPLHIIIFSPNLKIPVLSYLPTSFVKRILIKTPGICVKVSATQW